MNARRARNCAVVVCAVALWLAACVPPAPPPPRPTATAAAKARPTAVRPGSAEDAKQRGRRDGLEGGTLVFADDFERAELGGDWRFDQPGEWTVEAGALRSNRVEVYEERNKGVWLKRPLPTRVRVEFRGEVRSGSGDIKCEIFATEPKHEAGYSVIFGGWNNTINAIARLGEHEPARRVQRPHVPVRSQQRYLWTLVRTDGVVRWYVDGRFMLAYDDAAPVQGGYFGFNNWLSDVRFDEVRVYDLDAPAAPAVPGAPAALPAAATEPGVR